MRLKEVGKNVLFVILAVAIVFGAVELVLRVTLKIAPVSSKLKVPYMPIYPFDNKPCSFFWGLEGMGPRRRAVYPAAKRKGYFRVVCLGASTTAGFGLDDPKKTWPSRLEEELNTRCKSDNTHFEVINAGMVGVASLSGYACLKRLIQSNYMFDLVIWNYVINDCMSPLDVVLYMDDLSAYKAWLKNTRAQKSIYYFLRKHFRTFTLLERAIKGRPKPVAISPYRVPPNVALEMMEEVVGLVDSKKAKFVAMREFTRPGGKTKCYEQRGYLDKEFCQQRGCYFLDGLEAFDAGEDTRNYVIDVAHLNEVGNQLYARWVADKLIKMKVVPCENGGSASPAN